MIEPTQDDVGRAVVYTGNRYPGGKLEEGVITSFTDHRVFDRCSDLQGRAPRPRNFCATPTPTSQRSSRPCASTGCRSATPALADYCLRGCSCRLPLNSARKVTTSNT